MASAKKNNQVRREQLTDQQWSDACRLFRRLDELQKVARERLAVKRGAL